MNLKSVAMATGLVLTFAAGAWLSTIMLAPPQRPNRVAVQEQERTPALSPQSTVRPAGPSGTAAGDGSLRLHSAAASAIASGTRRGACGASAGSSSSSSR